VRVVIIVDAVLLKLSPVLNGNNWDCM
jgi:hypothetical protein